MKILNSPNFITHLNVKSAYILLCYDSWIFYFLEWITIVFCPFIDSHLCYISVFDFNGYYYIMPFDSVRKWSPEWTEVSSAPSDKIKVKCDHF